ncbi:hypothetical protein SDD30_13185 [Moorella naiadis]|uniref:hypothetical protein n=1 Tax=Moorella naiadis (nom. illeg.) TaxID=3093670 RepID=UPI003D9CA3E8
MQKERRITDPRPDIKEDSVLWEKLLNLKMVALDYDVCWLLHGFRCQGTVLVKHNDTYVLRPLVGKDGWESAEEYKKQRDIYLVPHRDKIALALKEVAKELTKAGA